MKQTDRIQQMETYLDECTKVFKEFEKSLKKYEEVQKAYHKLSSYYMSPQWMKDFEADEAGKLPKDLKRGVLSEDAVFDLMDRNQEIVARLLAVAAEDMKKR
ncbi:MAG: DUF4298 domain-containing protein [Erysipelotrichaceae bacterium]|nr:DUF4298 domain-containing protein [Erysipelotrichaceae bacterium]